jgi:hypothetical protein
MNKKFLNKNILIYILNFFVVFIFTFLILFLFSSYDSNNDELLYSLVLENNQYYQFECEYNSIEKLSNDEKFDYEKKYSHNSITKNELKNKGIDAIYMTYGHNNDYSNKFNIYFVDDQTIGINQFSINNDLFYSLGEPEKIDNFIFDFGHDIDNIEFSLCSNSYNSDGIFLNYKALDAIKFNVIKDYYPLNFGGIINFISLSYAKSQNYVSSETLLNENEIINLTNYDFDGNFLDAYLNKDIRKYFDDTYIDFKNLLGFNKFEINDDNESNKGLGYLVLSDNVFYKCNSKINPYYFATKCSNENKHLLSSSEYYVDDRIDKTLYSYLETSVRTDIFNYLIPILIVVLVIYVYFFDYIVFYKNKNDLVVLYSIKRNKQNGQLTLNLATFVINLSSCVLSILVFYIIDSYVFPKNIFGFPDYIFGLHCICFSLLLLLFFAISFFASCFVYKKKINYLSIREML